MAHGDVAALATLAHQIKGTAGAYGFPALGEAAGLLATAVKSQRPTADIEDEARRVIDLCFRIRAGRSKSSAAARPTASPLFAEMGTTPPHPSDDVP